MQHWSRQAAATKGLPVTVHNEKIPPVGAHGGNELNEKYDITGNEAISYSQSAEILSNALGRRITYVNITEEVARKAMKKMGMEDWLIDALIEFYNVIKSGDASQSLQSLNRLQIENLYHLNNLSEIMLVRLIDCVVVRLISSL